MYTIIIDSPHQSHRGFAGLCFLLAAAFLTVFSIKVFQEVEMNTIPCEPHTFLKIAARSTQIKKVMIFNPPDISLRWGREAIITLILQ